MNTPASQYNAIAARKLAKGRARELVPILEAAADRNEIGTARCAFWQELARLVLARTSKGYRRALRTSMDDLIAKERGEIRQRKKDSTTPSIGEENADAHEADGCDPAEWEPEEGL